MNKALKALIIISSIVVSILFAVYFFLVYKAHGARKQIERLNKMIDIAELNGNEFASLTSNN